MTDGIYRLRLTASTGVLWEEKISKYTWGESSSNQTKSVFPNLEQLKKNKIITSPCKTILTSAKSVAEQWLVPKNPQKGARTLLMGRTWCRVCSGGAAVTCRRLGLKGPTFPFCTFMSVQQTSPCPLGPCPQGVTSLVAIKCLGKM